MRRAAAALLATVAAVVWLVRYDTSPPGTLNPSSALRREAPGRLPPTASAEGPGEAVGRSGVLGGPGTRSGTGPLRMTPFSVIQVRATLRRGRLVGVETVELSGDDPHTRRLNARAEPVLREEALEAGSADIDAVTGATYTSESWKDSLEAAIAAARGG